MTLSDLSIKKPVFAWMLMTGLIVFGWVGFSRMGISQLPDVDFPVISVHLSLEGAAPVVMETEVTDVVEDAVMSVQGVKEVSSVSKQGSANVTVEFELGRDIDVALQEVQTKVAQAQRNLPADMDPPVVTKSNPEDQPIMWVSLSSSSGEDTALPPNPSSGETLSDRSLRLPQQAKPDEGNTRSLSDTKLRDLMAYTKDVMKNRFTTVPGVGEVILGGYIDPNLRVWADIQKMEANELTVTDLIQSVQSEHDESPAGYIDTGKQELNVRVMGEAGTVESFSHIVIPKRGGSPVWTTLRLGDVATIEDGLDEVRRISRFKGTPSVGLGIKKQRGTNAVAVARAVKARVAELEPGLPPGMKLRVVFDTTRFIEESTQELTFTLILSALLTGLVCWLFLGSWSSTVNVLLAIPTSIIGSFLILYFMGFTLNTFTLLGLSLAIGIVVDDAIMVLENIVRHREMGASRIQAALTGARQITFAAMAASVAILAIFIPVVFMKGIIGAFFFQFGVTMSVAVLLSLLEALTLTPMRCSQFLQAGHEGVFGSKMEALIEWSKDVYRFLLDRCLHHRWKVIAATVVFSLVSFGLLKWIKMEFVPPQDQSRFLVRLQTPIGTSIQVTDKVARTAEAFFAGRGEVDSYYAAIGGFGGGQVNTAMMFVTLKPFRERPVSEELKKRPTQQELMGLVRRELNKIPGVERAVVQDLSLSGFSAQRGFPVEFTIRGPDWDTLGRLSDAFMKKMNASGLMVDVDTDYEVGMAEVRVIPDREKAAARGVSIKEIGETINAMIGGVRIGKYTKGGKRYDIRVRLVDDQRSKPEDINRILVRNHQGELIRLSDVVTIQEEPSLQSISRRNRERAIGMNANIAPGKSQEEAVSAVNAMAREILPPGYRIALSGSAETFRESFQSLFVALILGIFVAYMVLGSQFNSFIHPFTVLLALPFSITGAFLALLIGGQSLNLYSMIGIILLMGIVKKNSILLVDFTIRERLAKPDRSPASGGGALLPDTPHLTLVHDALLRACPTRLRPILMTSFSTIAAAIPPALGMGPGAEARIPMALVVIGGVLVSTFLTLFVVPCAYSLLVRFESHRHDRDQ